MNDQAASAIRSLLKVVGGVLVTKGLTDSSTNEIVISAVMVLAGFAWSYFHHSENPTNPPPSTP